MMDLEEREGQPKTGGGKISRRRVRRTRKTVVTFLRRKRYGFSPSREEGGLSDREGRKHIGGVDEKGSRLLSGGSLSQRRRKIEKEILAGASG